MTVGRLKTQPHCPSCDKTLDGFSAQHKEIPKPGDLTVCVYCSEILEFTAEMELQSASAETIADIDFVELQHINKIVLRIQRENN
jgi:hypothetical protein